MYDISDIPGSADLARLSVLKQYRTELEKNGVVRRQDIVNIKARGIHLPGIDSANIRNWTKIPSTIGYSACMEAISSSAVVVGSSALKQRWEWLQDIYRDIISCYEHSLKSLSAIELPVNINLEKLSPVLKKDIILSMNDNVEGSLVKRYQNRVYWSHTYRAMLDRYSVILMHPEARSINKVVAELPQYLVMANQSLMELLTDEPLTNDIDSPILRSWADRQHVCFRTISRYSPGHDSNSAMSLSAKAIWGSTTIDKKTIKKSKLWTLNENSININHLFEVAKKKSPASDMEVFKIATRIENIAVLLKGIQSGLRCISFTISAFNDLAVIRNASIEDIRNFIKRQK